MGEQLERVIKNFAALGAQRQIAVMLAIPVIAAMVIGLAFFLSKPATTVLYSGLDRSDVASISGALSQAGIAFDVNSKGDGVLVPGPDIAKARMLLAERGLPRGPSSGYELFDGMGSMGLTSFMQEVTRKRALEGELARTIEAMQGVLAARVHLVMQDGGTFRREARKPSASVVIRTASGGGAGLPVAIRHLVAAAVPGLSTDRVSILSTDGMLLAGQGDGTVQVPNQQVQLETKLGASLEQKIRETLAPFLGVNNFRISVTARLNMDKLETRETAFDPKSKVERSLRVTKETKTAENSAGEQGVSVEQNLPAEEPNSAGQRQSKKFDERREELTNFEVGSKTVSTLSDGYRIERLSVAVLVNQSRLASALGNDSNASDAEEMLARVKALVSAAVGLESERGDEINVSTVDFLGADEQMEPLSGSSIVDQLVQHFGTLINGLVAITIAALVIMLAIRPIFKALLRENEPAPGGGGAALAESASTLALPASAVAEAESAATAQSNIDMSIKPGRRTWTDPDDPKQRLSELAEDEEAAVRVMREWLQEEVA